MTAAMPVMRMPSVQTPLAPSRVVVSLDLLATDGHAQV